MRRFNVTGLCVPEKDYMVDISGKIAQIRKLVDDGSYFTINRGRQYGKTTTLAYLERVLKDEYHIASISFEGVGDSPFETEASFCKMFLTLTQRALRFAGVSEAFQTDWLNERVSDFDKLSHHISSMCRCEKVVLMIDEVDATSNNRVFLRFLGLLRDKFLARKGNNDYTFHSVILAGVYNIKNIKLKMINEGTYTPTPTEGKLYNSPWNIAINFKVDMSFNPSEIATMLADYEADHNTGMNIHAIAEEIHNYTGGYPFLVSRICQCIDEELNKDWTLHGILETVKIMLEESNTLFDDLIKNLENNKNLFEFIQNLLIEGREYSYNIDDPLINLGDMYGFLKKDERGKVSVANRIFEIRICNYFISKNATSKIEITGVLQYDVVEDGIFDMELCLRKFAEHYAEIYNEKDAPFLERNGRLLFLTYLKPLINGQGFYHIESQLTDLRRMDLVVDFGNQQFIIELKLWKGEATHEKAYKQLAGYLDKKNVKTGYLLTFDFRKGVTKETYAKWAEENDKLIFDFIV